MTIKERVSKYNIDDEIMDEINDAIASAIRMIRLQAHSFLLIDATSTIDIPSNYIVTFLNTGTSISSEEIALTDEEKFEKALYLLFSPEYSEQQKIISENLSKSNIQLNVKHLERQNEYNSNLNVARIFLWSSIASILIINNLFFFVLLKKLVFPISRFAKQIELNDRLETEHSLYEANYLALSYNALLDRHIGI